MYDEYVTQCRKYFFIEQNPTFRSIAQARKMRADAYNLLLNPGSFGATFRRDL